MEFKINRKMLVIGACFIIMIGTIYFLTTKNNIGLFACLVACFAVFMTIGKNKKQTPKNPIDTTSKQ